MPDSPDALAATEPMSFSEYMAKVLYAAETSFYRVRSPGSAGTYQTSPSLTPWFGRLVCRAFDRMHGALGLPDTFHVTEWGAGDAAFAYACGAAAQGDLANALRWRFVEPFDEIASAQRDRMRSSNMHAEWFNTDERLAPTQGCVFANEVIDNLPVDIFEIGDDGLIEIKVVAEEGRFHEVSCDVARDVPEEARRAAELLSVGDRFEVRRGLEEFVARLSSSLSNGYLMLFDYGDLEPTIWTSRPAGTVVTYGAGRLGVDPFEDPGGRDITAHVNFTQLKRIAETQGFSNVTLLSQRKFLEQLGALEEIDRLRGAGSASDLAERSRLAALLQPGLGDLVVLLAVKEAEPFW